MDTTISENTLSDGSKVYKVEIALGDGTDILLHVPGKDALLKLQAAIDELVVDATVSGWKAI